SDGAADRGALPRRPRRLQGAARHPLPARATQDRQRQGAAPGTQGTAAFEDAGSNGTASLLSHFPDPGDPMYEVIHYAVEDRTAFITLDRPEDLNTIVPPMLDELEHAVRRATADEQVKA